MAHVHFIFRHRINRSGPHVALRTKCISSLESTRAVDGFREENKFMPEVLDVVVS